MLAEIFREDKDRLDQVIGNNVSERAHIERCNHLAKVLDWESGNLKNEFAEMLGSDGVRLLDHIILSIKRNDELKSVPELSSIGKVVEFIMFVHDLGKYDPLPSGRYNGNNHEARSAQIVWDKKEVITDRVNWQEDTVCLIKDLVLYHGALSITLTGEASLFFLLPILERIRPYSAPRKRLFLDLLIIVTCCDAGASGNLKEGRYFLDFFHLKSYVRITNYLYKASMSEDIRESLMLEASGVDYTVDRIQRMLRSSNHPGYFDVVLTERVLRTVMDKGRINLRQLALTRFDHGVYVFNPIAQALIAENHTQASICHKMILLLGLLCKKSQVKTTVNLRDSFSMKVGLRDKNKFRFLNLLATLETEEVTKIEEILIKYEVI